MAEFDAAIDVVLEHEGGFVNNVHDPGGATKYGISLRFLRSLKGFDFDLDGDGDVDAKDVKAMTRDQAVAFYQVFFWDPAQLDSVTDQRCATKVFDVAVNMGPRRADKLALLACDRRDGDTRRVPIDEINSLEPDAWLRAMCVEQKKFYAHLIVSNPKLEEFRVGWYRRSAWPFRPQEVHA